MHFLSILVFRQGPAQKMIISYRHRLSCNICLSYTLCLQAGLVVFLDIRKCLGCSFGLTAEFSVAFLVEQYFVWRAVARFSKQNVPLWEAVEPYLCKGTLISQNYASISGYEDSYFGSTEIIKYLPNMLTELQLPCTVNLNNNHFFVWFLFSDEKVFWRKTEGF